jgi:hypothetical protein
MEEVADSAGVLEQGRIFLEHDQSLIKHSYGVRPPSSGEAASQWLQKLIETCILAKHAKACFRVGMAGHPTIRTSEPLLVDLIRKVRRGHEFYSDRVWRSTVAPGMRKLRLQSAG